jgi:uncharacterized glyoxalase superfamily protein PhnB
LGATILQPAADFPHGWRDVILEDPDGYIWAVGVPQEKCEPRNLGNAHKS